MTSLTGPVSPPSTEWAYSCIFLRILHPLWPSVFSLVFLRPHTPFPCPPLPPPFLLSSELPPTRDRHLVAAVHASQRLAVVRASCQGLPWVVASILPGVTPC